MTIKKYSYITMINTDSYLNGALCLYESLKHVGAKYMFTVLVTGDVSDKSKSKLKKYGINVIESNGRIDVPEYIKEKNIKGNMPHWNKCFDKLLIFELVEFDKLIFLDSDMFIIENIDHLFEKDNMSAVILGKSFPNDYYSNWTRENFSSGLMIIKPEKNVVEEMCKYFDIIKNKEGCIGDQEILWEYFSEWKDNKQLHLSERYTVCYEHLEFYMRELNYKVYRENSENNISAIHFSSPKPWLISRTIRIKYILYNYIKGNFKIVKVLNNYFKILRKVERYI